MTTQNYTGSCHCGAVRFAVDLDLDQAIACNCSICTKRGFIWAFAPISQFQLGAGSAATEEYLFNKHAIRHQFCPSCGVEAFAYGSAPDGTETAAINVRCLDGIDLAALKPTPYDGANS
jgi:hypothetical protein